MLQYERCCTGISDAAGNTSHETTNLLVVVGAKYIRHHISSGTLQLGELRRANILTHTSCVLAVAIRLQL
jgi:hypothetical protein